MKLQSSISSRLFYILQGMKHSVFCKIFFFWFWNMYRNKTVCEGNPNPNVRLYEPREILFAIAN